eukprot:gnl/MRDRNA2_/MRDRNA2_145478_c0_seq1.p1 gnl/MRDRNA2_/MRDRNA2_145478_c0~~gnl/MRDRNA2_/MRDRNA2_145478_c0_seq1.p1  ORF type:complete len:450 (+),score=79.18 gnl/MRDRNA2_/MRDRNA2_145478_c0_seq1:50-1399(+)
MIPALLYRNHLKASSSTCPKDTACMVEDGSKSLLETGSAKHLADLCGQIYVEHASPTPLIDFHVKGLRAWVKMEGESSDSALIIFRGTVTDLEKDPEATVQNVITDASIRLVDLFPFESYSSADGKNHVYDSPCQDLSTIQVHAGFNDASTELLSVILPTLKTKVNDLKKVGLTGHSLGGALATLTAVKLKVMGVEDVNVVTFGCPKVGNEDFKALYEKLGLQSCTARFVHDMDPVPHLPFGDKTEGRIEEILKSALMQKLIAGGDYLHVCAPCSLDDLLGHVAGIVQIVADSIEKQNLSGKDLMRAYLQNHGMSLYAENVVRLAEGSLLGAAGKIFQSFGNLLNVLRFSMKDPPNSATKTESDYSTNNQQQPSASGGGYNGPPQLATSDQTVPKRQPAKSTEHPLSGTSSTSKGGTKVGGQTIVKDGTKAGGKQCVNGEEHGGSNNAK